MDEDRRIRFLVAPTLFVALLLLGALSNQAERDFILEALKNPDWSKLIGLIAGFIAGGGLVVFVLGYVIGTWTYFVLRVFFLLRPRSWGKSRFHEIALSDSAFKKVWEIVLPSGVPDRRQELSAGVAFDHDFLRKTNNGVHLWLVRRWNAFSIAATSFWALVFSFPIGHAVGIPMEQVWWLPPAAIFAAILVVVSFWAWRDTMNMLEFMASSGLMSKDE